MSLVLAGLPVLAAVPPTDMGPVFSLDTKLKIHGVIDRIQGNVLFAKTPWGRYAIGTTKKFRHLAVGDEVILYVNGDNAVVDVRRKGAPTPKHRWLTGFLRYTTPTKDAITLWTDQGWKEFKVEPQVVAQLLAIPEGSPITVQLNEDGKVIDVDRLDITLHVSKPYAIEKGSYMEVPGVVTHVRGPLVFVDTPVGQMTIANVMKAKLVNPGERVLVRLDERYTAVDVRKANKQQFAYQYLTGKLVYTDASQEAIRIETPEGLKVIPLSLSQREALASVRPGEYITVELDEQGKAVRIYKARGQG